MKAPGHMLRHDVWRVLLVWALAFLTGSGVAHAQLSSVTAPEQLVVGQRANLFVTWDGQMTADGVVVELPEGWTLRQADALRYGWEQQPVTIRREQRAGSRPRYVVQTSQPMKTPHELALSVQAGEAAERVEWQVFPFTLREGRLVEDPGYAVSRAVRVRPPEPDDGNHVLAFSPEDDRPLVLHRDVLPRLETRDAYTVALWVRTTGLDEVVLSTWNGNEEEAYPLEMVVEPSGRLAVYRGRPGHHEAMKTRRPLADGTWHHVALTHAPDGSDEGRWRLYVDAVLVDSLRAAEPVSTPVPGLALGSRLARAEAPAAETAFTGVVDDLTMLPEALPLPVLRRHRYEPAEMGDAGLLLDFEEPLPTALVAYSSERATRQPEARPSDEANLVLQARLLSEGVELSWQAPASSEVVTVVERSADGRTYEQVARLGRADADYVAENMLHFRYTDVHASGRVFFYRVRQLEAGSDAALDAEEERARSRTLKVGMGGRREEEMLLVGNFPNPFTTATTISYELPETEEVRVAVWDLSGHQVALLVDEVQQPGPHEVQFAADELPSGTYFVRLQTPSRHDTHKMTLMK